jgi:hypothetical protein
MPENPHNTELSFSGFRHALPFKLAQPLIAHFRDICTIEPLFTGYRVI